MGEKILQAVGGDAEDVQGGRQVEGEEGNQTAQESTEESKSCANQNEVQKAWESLLLQGMHMPRVTGSFARNVSIDDFEQAFTIFRLSLKGVVMPGTYLN